MKPVRHPLVPGPGQRTPQTLLLIDERDGYLREAATFFHSPSDREVARQLRNTLMTYRDRGAWRRDYAEALCPVQYAGTVKAALWKTLKAIDATPSVETIRKVLAKSP